MSSRTGLLILTLTVILGVALFVIMSDEHNPISGKPRESYKPGLSYDADQAVIAAKKVYSEKKNLGLDFANGPCLTNDLIPNWVADIAHNPRKAVDNQTQNQCQAYQEGRAKHFVELDPDGNIIRAL